MCTKERQSRTRQFEPRPRGIISLLQVSGIHIRAAQLKLKHGEPKGRKRVQTFIFSVTLVIAKNGTAFMIVQKLRKKYPNAQSKNYLCGRHGYTLLGILNYITLHGC